MSADAHSLLGSALARHEYQWDMAEAEIRRALQLDPNSATAHFELSQNVLAPQERWDEAVAEDRRALELDPLSPTLAAGHAWLLHLQRKDVESIAAFRALAAQSPGLMAVSGLALVLLQHGDIQQALDVLADAEKLAQTPTLLAFRGYAYGRAGRKADAKAVLQKLLAQSTPRSVAPADLQLIYTGLGDWDNAFRYLSEARRQQASALTYMRVDAVYDPLRSDPRFDTMLAEVGLSDDNLQKRRGKR